MGEYRIQVSRLKVEDKKYYKLIFDEVRSIASFLKQFEFVRYYQPGNCYLMPANDKLIFLMLKKVQGKHIWIDLAPIRSKEKKPLKAKKALVYQPLFPENLEKMVEFVRYMRTLRYSEATIKAYGTYLKKFLVECQPKLWHQLSKQDIGQFNFTYFVKRNMSRSSQNQFIGAIKLFYGFAAVNEIVPDDITRPKKLKRLPNVLSQAEVKVLLGRLKNQKHKCLLCLIYGGGMRIGEVLRLQLADVRSEEGLIYIRRAKGGKDRRIPLSESMLRMLREYYKVYRPKRYIFEGRAGGMYSSRSAQKVLKKAALGAGIKVKITLHTLRHSYATHLLEKGVGLRYIQELLGHSSPKTTMIYTHVSGKKLSEISSPLDDLDL